MNDKIRAARMSLKHDLLAVYSMLKEDYFSQYLVTLQRSLHSLQSDNLDGLTQRETECILFLSLGYTAKDMADELGLSPKTIQHHLENIKQKLGCRKKSHIVKSVLLKAHTLKAASSLDPSN
jgi:DNA-binding CsgD family transcriptional regulator